MDRRRLLIREIVHYRRWIIFAFQIALICVAVFGAFLIRFEFHWRTSQEVWLFGFLLITLAVKIPLYQFFNLNQGWWRYTSVSDVLNILKCSLLSSTLIFIFSHFLLTGFSKGVLCIEFGLSFLLLGGARIGIRILRERASLPSSGRRSSDKKAIIVGAGAAGLGLLRQLQQSLLAATNIVGLVDDDRRKEGMHFYGVPVLGSLDRLSDVCNEKSINEVFIAIPTLPKTRLKEVMSQCLQVAVRVRMIPPLSEIIKGGSSAYQLRSVRVEDLLGREPIQLNKARVANELSGKTILVTGAGGSIGSELCRQISAFNPKRLVLLERSEPNLFYIERELRADSLSASVEIVPIIGDILDNEQLESVFSTYEPEIVYHSAAYKHVPLMEENPRQAVLNNVFGTCNLADISIKYAVKKFVMISTDKAVNPVSVMGYSKRLAELICQSKAGKGCQFISVRFGNVLGSSGSVVEIFKKQIENGGPLTVTDPNTTRFFMTAPEAVELVLHAGAHGTSGEIYMLDMGSAVKIVDLARNMIQLSDPDGRSDLQIKFIGMRKGEKLAEELVWEGEDFVPCPVEKVFRLQNKVETSEIDLLLQRLSDSNVDYARDLKFIVDFTDRRIHKNSAPHARKVEDSSTLEFAGL